MFKLAIATIAAELLDLGRWALYPMVHLIKFRPVVYSVAIINLIPTLHHRDSRAWVNHILLEIQRCREEDHFSLGEEEEVISEETWSDQTVEFSKVVEVLVHSRLKEEEAWVAWVAIWEDLIQQFMAVVLLIQP